MLVERGLQVQEVFGRNHNLKVSSGSGLGFFVKQAPPEDRRLDGPLAIEASVYRWAVSHPQGRRLTGFLSRLVHDDARNAILIFELLPISGSTAVSSEAYRATARVLAACHSIDRENSEDTLRGLSPYAPWVFDIARPHPESLRELAPAQLILFESLQASTPLREAIDRMHEGWQASCLIHADFKWSNLAHLSSTRGDRILLLDWELAQWGDPAWDVGGAMHAVIVEDILAGDLPADGGPERVMEYLGSLLGNRMRDHSDFWKAYCRERGFSTRQAAELRHRLPSHVGLRFIKTAYEWCQSETRVPRRAAAILQLGINMMLRPIEAAQAVLGLS